MKQLIKLTFNGSTLELVQGDITEQDTVAIVNAANTSLLGGGGVNGAIHKAGGPEILKQCKALGGCLTGEARITTGGNLKAKYVIHAVGPTYFNGKLREAELLANAYTHSLKLAEVYNIESIAFPSISTGIYSYPVKDAARVALTSIFNYFKKKSTINLIRFVLFDQNTYNTYSEVLENIITGN